MITAILVIYAFMAGLMAEYSHTELSKDGQESVVLESFLLGLVWPVAIWRAIK